MIVTIRRTAPRIALALLLTALALPASAHFAWVVTDKGVARIILSETLKFDDGVDADIVSKVTLSFKTADGPARALVVRKANQDYVADAPANGTLFGKLDLGLTKRGDTAHILVYFPKAIVGNPFSKDAQTTGAPVEILVEGAANAPRLKLIADGKPLPDTDMTLVLPDDSQKTVKTDAQGLTEPLTQSGRYGAWARHWIKESGQRDGGDYSEIRRYATLVFDLPAVVGAKSGSVTSAASMPRLPEATSSFGAVADGNWLYVYGGHISATHNYSRASVSGAFHRLNVSSGEWEALADAPAAQGMNLVVHEGKVYRVGGMRPENEPGKPSDTRSLSDVARFDPATRQWESLPSLPVPRSSHDVAVVGDKLIVVGGWNLRGRDPAIWADTMQVLDLKATPMKWQSVPQPFQRRAFVVATLGGSVYVLGGFDENDQVLDYVDVYDVARNTWSKGPALPKGPRNGFSPAACVQDGHVFVSVEDGGVYQLNATSAEWEKVGSTTSRVAHRMVPGGAHRLLVLGGATAGANLDSIESVDLPVAQASSLKRLQH